jgi:hypothetical protein
VAESKIPDHATLVLVPQSGRELEAIRAWPSLRRRLNISALVELARRIAGDHCAQVLDVEQGQRRGVGEVETKGEAGHWFFVAQPDKPRQVLADRDRLGPRRRCQHRSQSSADHQTAIGDPATAPGVCRTGATRTGLRAGPGPVKGAWASRRPVQLKVPCGRGAATTEGSYSFTLRVTDSAGASDTQTFTITVAPPRPVTINAPATVSGTVGHSYWIILTADGGMPYYTWALRSGTLPNGLVLTSNGSIAGVTTTLGTFSFTVAATDSRGTTANRTLAITVT